MHTFQLKINGLFSILLAVLLYNFVFPIRLRIFPGSEIFLYLITLSLTFFVLTGIRSLPKYRYLIPVILGSLLLVVLGILSVVYNDTYNYLFLVIIVKYLFAVYCGSVIVLMYIKIYGEPADRAMIKTIVFSGLLISTTCILEFFFPSTKSFFYQLINTSGNIEYDVSYRVHGLATGGGASLSVGLAICSVLAFFLSLNSVWLKKYAYLCIALIIYMSTLLVGRTGFFLLSFFLIIFLISNFSLSTLFLLGCSVFLILIFGEEVESDKVNFIYSHGLELIKNYIEHGSVESKTTMTVRNMYFLLDPDHMAIGAGFWRYIEHSYPPTDVGYMKVLLSFGLLGALIFYSLQAWLYSSGYRFFSRKHGFKLGFIFIFGVLFIGEFKEAFLVQNYGFKILILLIVYSFIAKYKWHFPLDRSPRGTNTMQVEPSG